MSRLRQMAFIYVAVLLSLFLVACEEDEDQKISEAQACLNNATPSTANTCLEKVSGLTSARSYYIRCSVRFLAEGFQGSRFADAFEQLSEDEGGSGGDDAMAVAFSIMSFDNVSTAQTTLDECLLSESRALSRLASISSMATLVVDSVGLLNQVDENGLSEAEKDQLIANLLSADSGNDEQLGSTALTAETLFCEDEDSEFTDTDICTNLDEAITAGNGDAAAIGAALRQALASN